MTQAMINIRVMMLGAIVRACEMLCCSLTTVFYMRRIHYISSIISATVHSICWQIDKVQMSLRLAFHWKKWKWRVKC